MANPKRNNERAARALVDAALFGDRKACKEHKITDRTLRNYRAALENDAELSALFRFYCKEATTNNWAEEIGATLSASARKLRELVEAADTPNPETIAAVTGAVSTLAEIAMTRDVLKAQLEPESSTLANDPPTHYVN